MVVVPLTDSDLFTLRTKTSQLHLLNVKWLSWILHKQFGVCLFNFKQLRKPESDLKL